MPSSFFDKADPTRVNALLGELGILNNPYMGGRSTEISMTAPDPRAPGKWVNFPSLVRGQTGIDDILQFNLTGENERVALARALARAAEGQELPSYDSDKEAVMAAQARSKMKDVFSETEIGRLLLGLALSQAQIPRAP